MNLSFIIRSPQPCDTRLNPQNTKAIRYLRKQLRCQMDELEKRNNSFVFKDKKQRSMDCNG
jgi:hypothetical protein